MKSEDLIKELDEISLRIRSFCQSQEDEIAKELKAMGQNIKSVSFKPMVNLAYYNDDDNIAVWNNKISSREQNLSEFERHKRHLLRFAFAINQYAKANWDEGNFPQTIYHLDEAVFILSLAYKLRDNKASLKEARSIVGKHNAVIRHEKTTHKIRKEVVDYWRERIDTIKPRPSNEKAGEMLHDIFPYIAVRKLTEYVSKAKAEMKKLPPTSKA